MKPLLIFSFVTLFLLTSCASKKSIPTEEERKALELIVSNKTFEIESDFAYPQVTNAVQQVLNSGLLQPGSTPGGINLIGNPNYLRVRNDSVISYLPYFGERQMRAGYGSGDGAIQLKSIMKDYSAQLNKDGSYSIDFNAEGQSENFQVYLRLFPNLKSTMVLNGIFRLPIQYSGSIKPMEN